MLEGLPRRFTGARRRAVGEGTLDRHWRQRTRFHWTRAGVHCTAGGDPGRGAARPQKDPEGASARARCLRPRARAGPAPGPRLGARSSRRWGRAGAQAEAWCLGPRPVACGPSLGTVPRGPKAWYQWQGPIPGVIPGPGLGPILGPRTSGCFRLLTFARMILFPNRFCSSPVIFIAAAYRVLQVK